ncbi:hypothetical protein HZR84_12095 [Hyphobacterium sp. CCMP332]|nr:hypothetical protein HZR84_12095 [Hyphobacterium sp. CCMP332]
MDLNYDLEQQENGIEDHSKEYYPKFHDWKDQDNEKLKLALDRAWQNRDFEINKYWQRAAYFWGFIVLLIGGYLTLKNSNKGEGILEKNSEFELYIILLGIIFSLAWYLVNLGSKRWQENWEGHIDALENEITGPIYKTLYKTGTFYSVSKINSILSFSILIAWFGLFIRFFTDPKQNKYEFIDFELDFSFTIALPIFISIWICIQLIKTGKNSFKEKKGYFLQRPSK